MRLLCDHNIGSLIVHALSKLGHDVERAIHVTPDAGDLVVLAYAVANDRILITCDSDFGGHVFLNGAEPPPAIIYIRFEPSDVADILPWLFQLLDFERLNGHMTVISGTHDRRTALPTKRESNG